MSALKRITAFFLMLMLCTGLLALPAMATHMVHEGLDVTIVMDKEQYDDGEPITATITVKNTNNVSVTITNLEQLIPDGYRLAENSLASMKNIELGAGQTVVLEVTFQGEETAAQEAQNEDFFAKIIYGETWGIPNILLTLIVIAAIAIFMWLT